MNKYKVYILTIHDTDLADVATVHAANEDDAFIAARKQLYGCQWNAYNLRNPLRVQIDKIED